MGRFNPRTRTGCDMTSPLASTSYLPVSTHAPARGATYLSGWGLPPQNSFNPRTRTGCDGAAERLSLRPCRFNPRTRTGCDVVARDPVSITEFQPTHPHGVRRGGRVQLPEPAVCFNPRTRTGCDE